MLSCLKAKRAHGLEGRIAQIDMKSSQYQRNLYHSNELKARKLVEHKPVLSWNKDQNDNRHTHAEG